ncbi:MAG: cofactor-independent phosphoglycerate mutase [Dehalococcoidales bacterium]
MKYVVIIIDGAAGWPLASKGGRTSLELARTPNLDAMAREGSVGMVRTVPPGMEPTSACACMSLLGYNPAQYRLGRAAIEAESMGVDIHEDEVVFRCNMITEREGRIHDYCAGHIGSEESRELISALENELGGDNIHFYPGVNYRHICKIKGHGETLEADCTPPHDIPGRPIRDYLPGGRGSDLLRDLMQRSVGVLGGHPVNEARSSRGALPANMIWLFWGSGRLPDVPPFRDVYGLRAAVTSGVDVIRGMARVMGMGVLDIAGVTDGMDNDFAAQGAGALEALGDYDLVVIHVEAPDESGHGGLVEDKVAAIEKVDADIAGRMLNWSEGKLRVMVMPDHPTPVELRTHTADPVPFLLWGEGFRANGGGRLTENEAKGTGLFVDPGHEIMSRLVGM